MKIWLRELSLLVLIFLVASLAPLRAGAEAGNTPAAPKENRTRQFLSELLPIAWQKRPTVRFNVFTEMTPEGRSRPEPTPQKPLAYFSPPGVYAQTGWLVSAGERAPPWKTLQDAMQKALAANGYVPIPNDRQQRRVATRTTGRARAGRFLEG